MPEISQAKLDRLEAVERDAENLLELIEPGSCDAGVFQQRSKKLRESLGPVSRRPTLEDLEQAYDAAPSGGDGNGAFRNALGAVAIMLLERYAEEVAYRHGPDHRIMTPVAKEWKKEIEAEIKERS